MLDHLSYASILYNPSLRFSLVKLVESIVLASTFMTRLLASLSVMLPSSL